MVRSWVVGFGVVVGCGSTTPAPVVATGAPLDAALDAPLDAPLDAAVTTATAEHGAEVFGTFGCRTCHAPNGAAGPLEAMWGVTVKSAAGETRTFDEAYVRESILTPQAFILVGFPSTMPAYAGLLADDDVTALVVYIKSLTP